MARSLALSLDGTPHSSDIRLPACGSGQRPVACPSVNFEVLINLLVIGGDPSGIGGPSDFLRGAVKMDDAGAAI